MLRHQSKILEHDVIVNCLLNCSIHVTTLLYEENEGLGAGEGLETPDPAENFRMPKKFQDVKRCFSKSICDLGVSSCLVRYNMPVLGGFNFHGQTANHND